MSRTANLATLVVETRDLRGYARERVEQEIKHDPTLNALLDAAAEADDRAHKRRVDNEYDDELADDLHDVIDVIMNVRDNLVDVIVEDACQGTVHGHEVDYRHSVSLDPCSSCEERTQAYRIGDVESDDHVCTDWICGHCGHVVEKKSR